MSDVKIMSWGLVYLTACSPKDTPVEEIERSVNVKHPTGLSHGWHLAEDETFMGGQPNPCECDTDAGRIHHLLSC